MIAEKAVNEENVPIKTTNKKYSLVGRARLTLKTKNGIQVIKSINSKERLLRTRVNNSCNNCTGACKHGEVNKA